MDTQYIMGMAPGVKTIVTNTNTSINSEVGIGYAPALF